jgi:hypothetical protein
MRPWGEGDARLRILATRDVAGPIGARGERRRRRTATWRPSSAPDQASARGRAGVGEADSGARSWAGPTREQAGKGGCGPKGEEIRFFINKFPDFLN